MTLTTYLAAEPAPWSDIAGTYDLDFGHLFTHPNNLKRRGNSARGVIPEWIKGNFDVTKTTDFDANFGDREKKQTIWHDDRQVSHFLSLFTLTKV